MFEVPKSRAFGRKISDMETLKKSIEILAHSSGKSMKLMKDYIMGEFLLRRRTIQHLLHFNSVDTSSSDLEI